MNQQKKSGEGSVSSPLFLRLGIPTWEAGWRSQRRVENG